MKFRRHEKNEQVVLAAIELGKNCRALVEDAIAEKLIAEQALSEEMALRRDAERRADFVALRLRVTEAQIAWEREMSASAGWTPTKQFGLAFEHLTRQE